MKIFSILKIALHSLVHYRLYSAICRVGRVDVLNLPFGKLPISNLLFGNLIYFP
jgi:hypothetical protein